MYNNIPQFVMIVHSMAVEPEILIEHGVSESISTRISYYNYIYSRDHDSSVLVIHSYSDGGNRLILH